MNKAFLKWAGGKSQLVPKILSLMPEKHSGRFFEPFVGSGVMALNVPHESIVIGDVNDGLMAVWLGLKRDGEKFIEDAKTCFNPAYNTKSRFYEWRDAFNNTRVVEQRGLLFLYLNRHCFNGLCRFNAKGGFNVPFGKYAKPYFPEAELRAALKVTERMSMGTMGFQQSFELVQKGDVVYCDPPYIPLSDTSNFTAYSKGGFGPKDQLALALAAIDARKRGATVIISNNDVPDARRLYVDATEIHEVQVRKAISCKGDGRKKSGEIIAVYRP
jgi:DNA adenine methylase